MHGVQGLDGAGHGLVVAHRRVGRAKQIGLEVPHRDGHAAAQSSQTGREGGLLLVGELCLWHPQGLRAFFGQLVIKAPQGRKGAEDFSPAAQAHAGVLGGGLGALHLQNIGVFLADDAAFF